MLLWFTLINAILRTILIVKKQWLFSVATQHIIIVHLIKCSCCEINYNLYISVCSFKKRLMMKKEANATLWDNTSLAVPSFLLRLQLYGQGEWCLRFAATDPEIISRAEFISNTRSPVVSPSESLFLESSEFLTKGGKKRMLSFTN